MLAHADDPTPNPDTFQPSVAVSTVYDDNIFRLPTGQPAGGPSGPSSRGDFDVTTQIGLRYDKSFSLQRVVIDAGIVDYDHTDHTFLDFVAKNLDATWFWAFTPELTGHVIYTRTQQLNSFADFTGLFQRNVNTNTTRRIDGDLRVRGELHFGMAVDEFVQRNDQPTFALEDVRIESVEPNISFQSEAGNSLTLYGRSADGTYLNEVLSPVDQIDTNFTEHEEGFRLSYQIDGKSGIYAQVGELSRTHEHFSSRNFSGPVAQFKYNLQLTGKTAFSASAVRTLGSYQSDTSSYLATNIFTLGPTWAVTGKTKLGARLQDVQYHFGGTLTPVPLRSDNIYGETIFADWSVRRDLDVVLSYVHSSRSSNYPGLEFADNTATLFARFSF
jgi:exopolysaccharide biosynthesis operon protein EpsL